MSFPASARLNLGPAPSELALAQELLNTRAVGGHVPDLLDDEADAAAWLDAVGLPTDAAHELDALRALRDEVLAVVRGDGGSGLEASARLTVGEGGRVEVEPSGPAVARLTAEVLIGLSFAQLSGTRQRLKVCRNTECASAFYDRSRNGSGVWHDVRTCGNAANLRAYRARKRAAD